MKTSARDILNIYNLLEEHGLVEKGHITHGGTPYEYFYSCSKNFSQIETVMWNSGCNLSVTAFHQKKLVLSVSFDRNNNKIVFYEGDYKILENVKNDLIEKW
jgi:hypothetical protein